ncbi:sulfotransferase domain-containing protein [Litoreibacter meonggei]|uniref:Sulfotransferase domain-containing protein n=1 Tax=Litoreibacter meonggei TaxID=1049199 RepID=A0A497UZE6_9RHOB|nr:sulfotransferase domain-containing protein [Litoreibacter meonggei]RLJ36212.1 sulfotransferase domain-containing protein [Litoreibacter meonggei]
MRLPDFIIIGAAKAGTTSLYAMLEQHDDIFLPKIKEPEFFARDDLYERGLETYAQAFAPAGEEQITGEASTLYSLSPLFPDTAARMKAAVPQVKLIYVMRHPVERAYSYYVQLVKNYQNSSGDTGVNRSFEEFALPKAHAQAAPRDQAFSHHDTHLPDTPELCLAGSDYVTQIEAYLAHFPREQILFLTQEDLRRDRVGTMRQITEFLGVSPLSDPVLSGGAAARNVSATYFEDRGKRAALRGIAKRLGPLWTLRKLLPAKLRHGLRGQALNRVNPEPQITAPPPMTPETRTALEARFAPMLPRLEALSGLTFEHWNLR